MSFSKRPFPVKTKTESSLLLSSEYDDMPPLEPTTPVYNRSTSSNNRVLEKTVIKQERKSSLLDNVDDDESEEEEDEDDHLPLFKRNQVVMTRLPQYQYEDVQQAAGIINNFFSIPKFHELVESLRPYCRDALKKALTQPSINKSLATKKRKQREEEEEKQYEIYRQEAKKNKTMTNRNTAISVRNNYSGDDLIRLALLDAISNSNMILPSKGNKYFIGTSVLAAIASKATKYDLETCLVLLQLPESIEYLKLNLSGRNKTSGWNFNLLPSTKKAEYISLDTIVISYTLNEKNFELLRKNASLEEMNLVLKT